MQACSLTPKPENKIEFDLSHLWKSPDESGCYAITNYDGFVLYIGQAKNIHNRMDNHLKNPEKRGKTPHGKGFWFYYILCPEIQLDSFERGWVNEYLLKMGELPFFNKVNPPA